jgi:hypothetical protein
MNNAIETLIETIKNDYYQWTLACAKGDLSEINKRMIEDFDDGLRFEEGRKYIKVLTGSSVWGFVVNVDNDKKFRKGDILKAAGYNAPARNAPRGNILDGGYSIRWTGPNYLI